MYGRKASVDRTIHRLLYLVLILFLTGIFLFAAGGPVERKPIYDPGLDVEAAIKESLEIAVKEHKHLLLMFGGNWCPWCRKLHELFQKNPEIHQFLQSHYILILVDVGETSDKPLNRNLVDQYRVKGFGYPSLAVLDPKGRLLSAQSTGVMEKGDAHDPARVLAFLKAQAPRPKE